MLPASVDVLQATRCPCSTIGRTRRSGVDDAVAPGVADQAGAGTFGGRGTRPCTAFQALHQNRPCEPSEPSRVPSLQHGDQSHTHTHRITNPFPAPVGPPLLTSLASSTRSGHPAPSIGPSPARRSCRSARVRSVKSTVPLAQATWCHDRSVYTGLDRFFNTVDRP